MEKIKMKRVPMWELLPQDQTVTVKEAFDAFKAFALCPLDGRYAEIMEKSMPYFSEYGLVGARVLVEVEFLKFLLKTGELDEIVEITEEKLNAISSISEDFNLESYYAVKKIEDRTKHDVKAAELYVAQRLEEMGMSEFKSFVHIGCTSEDITNIAYAINISAYLKEVWLEKASDLVNKLDELALELKDVPMMAHTHGQPASPTTVGKEMAVFVARMLKRLEKINTCEILGKFNGATGNHSAICVAFPNRDWIKLSKNFVESFSGIRFNPITTQIESHDYIAELLDEVRHFNNILADLDLDKWLYISMKYFKQKVVETEVGSSTMPHKVNPIKFENSEGNICIVNGLAVAMSDKLLKSRMQRDLSDSTVLRNIGMGFGYSLLAIDSTIAGLGRASVDVEALKADLEENWEVLAEPIQTMLRKYQVPDAYDQLKAMTRGKRITKDDLHEFINSLDMLSDEDRQTLLNLTPMSYIGYAEELAENWTAY